MSERTCAACGETKPITAYKLIRGGPNRTRKCAQCRYNPAARQADYQRHRMEQRAAQADYYRRNRDHLRANMRAYAAQNDRTEYQRAYAVRYATTDRGRALIRDKDHRRKAAKRGAESVIMAWAA